MQLFDSGLKSKPFYEFEGFCKFVIIDSGATLMLQQDGKAMTINITPIQLRHLRQNARRASEGHSKLYSKLKIQERASLV